MYCNGPVILFTKELCKIPGFLLGSVFGFRSSLALCLLGWCSTRPGPIPQSCFKHLWDATCVPSISMLGTVSCLFGCHIRMAACAQRSKIGDVTQAPTQMHCLDVVCLPCIACAPSHPSRCYFQTISANVAKSSGDLVQQQSMHCKGTVHKLVCVGTLTYAAESMKLVLGSIIQATKLHFKLSAGTCLEQGT